MDGAEAVRTDVAIIGGGLAGLACAMGLRGSGLHVTLLEAGEALGGRARSWTDETTGDVVDIGPHILLSEYANLLRLLDLLGTRDRVVWQTDKLLTLLDGRRTIDMRVRGLPAPMHLAPSLMKVPTLGLRDKLSNTAVTWRALRLEHGGLLALDEIDAARYLRGEGVSERLLAWFWATVCLAIMNVPVERCSAAALLGFYRQLVSHADYRIGFPAVGLGELFVPQARRVIEAGGVTIRTGTAVRSILASEDRCTGLALADGSVLDARFCIAAVPPQTLAELTPAAWRGREVFRDLGAFQASPYVSTYVWFDRKVTRERFWARVWSPDQLNCDSYDLSNIRSGWSGRPSVIATNAIHSHRGQSMTDEAIVARTLQEIADFAPAAKRAQVRHARVHRIPMGVPCPYPGTERLRPAAVSPLRGLLIAGDWTDTGVPACMEGAVRSGWLAAEAIWRGIGRPRTLARPLRPATGIARWLTPHGGGQRR